MGLGRERDDRWPTGVRPLETHPQMDVKWDVWEAVEVVGVAELPDAGRGVQASITSTALCPPNANELEIATARSLPLALPSGAARSRLLIGTALPGT